MIQRGGLFLFLCPYFEGPPISQPGRIFISKYTQCQYHDSQRNSKRGQSTAAASPVHFVTRENQTCPPSQVFLVYGRSGWIGGIVGELLTAQGAKWEYGTARLEDRAAILADIERVSPSSDVDLDGNNAIV